jgi:2-polyprenyl-6-methoxyphenol hydroxylase-like FAD-dependent oxidoreductase
LKPALRKTGTMRNPETAPAAIETPVLIAGGGPVGMTLALELARYGVRSVLVERNPTTTRHPKMDLTNGRSMELFKRLGLESKLRDVGVPRENCFDISWITTLAGHELYRFDYPSANEARVEISARNDGSQASEPGLRVSQIVIEPVLKTAVDASPLIDVRFGTAFERIVAQDDTGVTAEIRPTGGKPVLVRCSFLAGCDGGGSTVRRELGIKTDGNYNVASAYMVHFRSTALDVLQRWGVAWHYQSGTGTLIAQNDRDTWTLQRWLFPDMDPATLRPEDLLEEWAGTKFEYEILQANPWSAHFVVAESYRAGRVALAGDAAHQFVPTGGYGMNSGIADAIGLAWALAANLQGWGGPGLLDAYDRERRPTAWWHLAASQRHMGVRAEIGGVYAAAGDLGGDGPEAEAKRAAAGTQIATLGNAENESWGVELGYRYDDSPVIWPEPGAPTVDPITYRPSTWPGTRLPHVFLEDGVSIHDRLGLHLTLVALEDIDGTAIEAAAAARGIPLQVLRLGRPDLRPIYARDLLLVRPDQHVAWRGDRLPDDLDALLARVAGF